MVDSATLARLIDHAQAADAKLVLIGDPAQLGEIEAGGLFAALADRSEPIGLDEVIRHGHELDREGARRIREGSGAEAVSFNGGILQVTGTTFTSTPRAIAIRCLGELAVRFDVIACGDEVEHSKPSPDLFLLTSQRLGIPAGECLVLEDSEAGVRAARAAGMDVIIVPDLIEPSAEVAAMAVRVCRSLHDVLLD